MKLKSAIREKISKIAEAIECYPTVVVIWVAVLLVVGSFLWGRHKAFQAIEKNGCYSYYGREYCLTVDEKFLKEMEDDYAILMKRKLDANGKGSTREEFDDALEAQKQFQSTINKKRAEIKKEISET